MSDTPTPDSVALIVAEMRDATKDLPAYERISAQSVEQWADRLASLPTPGVPVERVRDWLPMETAPKGGGAELTTDPQWVDPPKILLLFAGGEQCVAAWDWYYAEGGRGCTDGVAWVEPVSGEPVSAHYGEPVRWQELDALAQEGTS